MCTEAGSRNTAANGRDNMRIVRLRQWIRLTFSVRSKNALEQARHKQARGRECRQRLPLQLQ